jgi:RNA recognition motif-containing protein
LILFLQKKGGTHGTAEKAGAFSCSKNKPLQASKILQSYLLGLWKGSHHPGPPSGGQEAALHGMLQHNSGIKGGNMNKKVYVANLPYQATEADLKALFSKAGDVMSVKIVQDRQTGQPRGIAFVEMSTQWEGRRAASMLNRQDFMGKNLLVKEATEKRGFRGR